ncbi:uncharacterized protein IL334_000224 [Kwoniella shivajii]|uniref:Uncharacterized protein n=1 Tax=Kwoniella shivajii TaxID=564305 RepID=A0ABZ1CQ19_9TREE|nr:hypothetical protein IL334_000224 [Kwoniella shivajii]
MASFNLESKSSLISGSSHRGWTTLDNTFFSRLTKGIRETKDNSTFRKPSGDSLGEEDPFPLPSSERGGFRPKVIVFPYSQSGCEFKDETDDPTSTQGVYTFMGPDVRVMSRVTEVEAGRTSQRRMELAEKWAAYVDQSVNIDRKPFWTLNLEWEKGDDLPSSMVRFQDMTSKAMVDSYLSWIDDKYRKTYFKEKGRDIDIKDEIDLVSVCTVQDFEGAPNPFHRIPSADLPLSFEDFSEHMKVRYNGYFMGDPGQQLKSSKAPPSRKLYSIIKPTTIDAINSSNTSDNNNQDTGTS